MLGRYSVDLPEEFWRVVLVALGRQPHDDVRPVVDAVHQQIAAQQQAAIPRVEPDPAAKDPREVRAARRARMNGAAVPAAEPEAAAEV